MTARRSLPNTWNLFNLQESPYFYDTLGDVVSRFPLNLFVGRETEATRLLATIAGSPSSRQAIGGSPGIGKTTLAQLVKSTCVERGYWATNAHVAFAPNARLAASISTTGLQQLGSWARSLGPTATPTQDDLTRAWKAAPHAVSQALDELVRSGCVLPLPKQPEWSDALRTDRNESARPLGVMPP
jgi:hypothetical protein